MGLTRRLRLSRALRVLVRRFGYELIRRHYYSPIPDLEALPPGFWERESALAGVPFDSRQGLEFVERELGPYLDEYRPPLEPTGNPRDFYLANGFYESVDAETLYAMVRRFRPERIIELGSGLSTLVIADARARGGDPADGSHTVYDPHARGELRPVLERVAQLRPVSAADVPVADFEQLRAGDLLFVDTTHTVKAGSDVNHVILNVLPALAPGVLVHFHDIFLPWEYPRRFAAESNFFWAEQYLLQAFLSLNDQYEVACALYALSREEPERLRELVPAAREQETPGAFWIRRR
jgi:hypothetical protein